MATSPERLIHDAIRDRVRSLYGVELAEVTLEYPPRLEFGDLACPVAFELARSLKRSPRLLAAEIVEGLGAPPGVSRMQIAGAGFINIFYRRSEAPKALLGGPGADRAPADGAEKVIVEHTNINPNKAAHIGHLRNAVLGDTLVRLLRHAGCPVEVQNYIDDTGVQVADLVVGFLHLRQLRTPVAIEQAVERAADGGRPRFDYYCWDLYAEVTDFYDADEARLGIRAETLRKMEEGVGIEAELARYLAPRIVRCHLATMERLNVRYDLLPWESHIIGLKFWARAFELLKASGAIRLEEGGDKKGCWIMDLPSLGETAPEEAKIIVRSNGTVTYVGKDIAYQLWKVGRLGRDFRYRRFHEYTGPPSAHTLWSTCVDAGEDDHPPFGGGRRVYNVIDVRQSYLQRVVQQGLRALGHEDAAERSHHFAYEMVALSPACAKALGLSVADEDEGRSHIEMSGRKGYGVKADDLIDALIAAARREVLARAPDLAGEADEIASKVAIGALRYFMIKYTRNKVIAFDFDEVLSFEGETGPYLLYSVVRARNIFRKMAERESFDPDRIAAIASRVDFSFLDDGPLDNHWELLSLLGRFDDAVRQSIRTHEPSIVARYAFTLAQRFNHFYHQFPVMQETDENLKSARIVLTHLFLQYQTRALDLMGIEVPPRM
ncbi:MAG TPA: arginine--tRNA ligase [Candidatus Polarisedimenticolia bacterium]|nr:arginine--tRNA ligase [Candidatus Polarisedimenticolia bacterium]